MKAYYFEIQTKNEQTLFFSLCCTEDRQKLTREIPMSFYDFLRISCILFYMNFIFYESYLNELFPEYSLRKEDMIKRHRDILNEYPDYYKDECFHEKMQLWLTEFCDQIPDKLLRATYRKKFKNMLPLSYE